MGEPIPILKLAKQMIRLSGLTVKEDSYPEGDIEIISTGLRAGEKLYEELLINAEAKPTNHPQIFQAKENFISPEYLWKKLDNLENALLNEKEEEALVITKDLVVEWDQQKERKNI